jgi:hypothetical protein
MTNWKVDQDYINRVRTQLRKMGAMQGGILVNKKIMEDLLFLAEHGLEYLKLLRDGHDLDKVYKDLMKRVR